MKRPLTIFVPHCSDLLTDHLPHGDGLIAYGFISHLARRGHRLHVAAQRVDLREPLHPNVTVSEIPLICSGKLSKRAEYMLRVRRLLRRLKNDHRFDLIHQLNPVFSGISLSLTGSGLPLVLGTYVARWPLGLDAATKSWTSKAVVRFRDTIASLQQRQADALLLTTPAALDRLPHPTDAGDRIHFLPHGIDAELFSPACAADSTERSTTDQVTQSVLFFAHIKQWKGIFTLIEAFPAVARECPDTKLVIAGDGPDMSEARRRATSLDCAAQVEFLGRQERVDAPALYRNCSVYCLPSFGEPYATTVIEAMSCGKPLVVTDAGGLPHMISKEGAICIPAGDAVVLSKALVELLRDPERRAAMGRHNRDLVERTMSWDRVVEQLEQIYEITIQRFSSRRNGNRRSEGFSLEQTSSADIH
jgi:glycosyltransferase involved in cell wall biosynthesis